MAFIEARDLCKSFGRIEALCGVGFTVEEGEILGLLGPNGAGKTTALSVMTGLLRSDRGDVSIGGYSVRRNPQAVKGLLGLVPQDVALYARLSARENLNFWGRMYGLSGGVLRARVNEVLDLVGLEGRADEPVVRFSGGMKRRLNIAAGLLHRPAVLILDEPTVGVDPQSRNHIFEMIKELNRAGTTVIYTSHYMEEVELLCARVVIMDRGRVVASGRIADLIGMAGEAQELEIIAAGISLDLVEKLRALPDVWQVLTRQDGLVIQTGAAEETLARAFALFTGAKAAISRIEIRRPNLETLFMKITGRSLRD
ncbi:MAG: ABC transporter ATP-binding protein [Firmicutes bacterium]|nr:ABC transporter ATP-binding protein [Bacillota bacterium]